MEVGGEFALGFEDRGGGHLAPIGAGHVHGPWKGCHGGLDRTERAGVQGHRVENFGANCSLDMGKVLEPGADEGRWAETEHGSEAETAQTERELKLLMCQGVRDDFVL